MSATEVLTYGLRFAIQLDDKENLVFLGEHGRVFVVQLWEHTNRSPGGPPRPCVVMVPPSIRTIMIDVDDTPSKIPAFYETHLRRIGLTERWAAWDKKSNTWYVTEAKP